MTSQSPRIYIYKITFIDTPYYYYGVHKEKRYNEEYWGSPVTHKWCWELYTPEKQILEIFDYTDDGYIKAQEVEKRIIKLFLNDKWSLNENCGGLVSIAGCRKGGILMGNYLYENGLGIHKLTKEQQIENGRKGNKEGKRKSGKNAYLMKTGVHAFTPEERKECGKKGGARVLEMKAGIHSLTLEQRSENGKKANEKNKKNKTALYSLTKEQRVETGKKSGKKMFEEKLGIFSLTEEEKIKYSKIGGKKAAKIMNSQKWKCLITGHITNPGALTKYQRARGIDISLREKVS